MMTPTELQVPDIIGVEVNCLMGIKYSLLCPDVLHTFPTSGLIIIASKLKSHDGEIRAMMGSSHESFEFFSAMIGSVQNLIQSSQCGLQRFRDGAMPRILGNPITFEEIECAKKSNLKFGEIVGLQELLGDDGLFEEYGVADATDVVME